MLDIVDIMYATLILFRSSTLTGSCPILCLMCRFCVTFVGGRLNSNLVFKSSSLCRCLLHSSGSAWARNCIPAKWMALPWSSLDFALWLVKGCEILVSKMKILYPNISSLSLIVPLGEGHSCLDHCCRVKGWRQGGWWLPAPGWKQATLILVHLLLIVKGWQMPGQSCVLPLTRWPGITSLRWFSATILKT